MSKFLRCWERARTGPLKAGYLVPFGYFRGASDSCRCTAGSTFQTVSEQCLLGNSGPVGVNRHRLTRLSSAFFRAASPAAPLSRRLEPNFGRAVGTLFSRHETLTSSFPFPTAFSWRPRMSAGQPTGYDGAAPACGLADNVSNPLAKGFSAGAFIYRTQNL
jgi:hypothetical protein